MNVEQNLQELNEMLDAQLTEFRYGNEDDSSRKYKIGAGVIGGAGLGYGGYKGHKAIMSSGGYKAAGERTGKYVGDKAGRAGAYVKSRGAQAGGYMGGKASQVGNYAAGKASQAGNYATGKVAQGRSAALAKVERQLVKTNVSGAKQKPLRG